MWTLLCRKVLWKGRFAAQPSKSAVLAPWRGAFRSTAVETYPEKSEQLVIVRLASLLWLSVLLAAHPQCRSEGCWRPQ